MAQAAEDVLDLSIVTEPVSELLTEDVTPLAGRIVANLHPRVRARSTGWRSRRDPSGAGRPTPRGRWTTSRWFTRPSQLRASRRRLRALPPASAVACRCKPRS